MWKMDNWGLWKERNVGKAKNKKKTLVKLRDLRSLCQKAGIWPK
jgi:hypothetical protein